MRKRRSEFGINDERTMHMVFLGNPGTGKKKPARSHLQRLKRARSPSRLSALALAQTPMRFPVRPSPPLASTLVCPNGNHSLPDHPSPGLTLPQARQQLHASFLVCSNRSEC